MFPHKAAVFTINTTSPRKSHIDLSGPNGKKGAFKAYKLSGAAGGVHDPAPPAPALAVVDEAIMALELACDAVLLACCEVEVSEPPAPPLVVAVLPDEALPSVLCPLGVDVVSQAATANRLAATKR